MSYINYEHFVDFLAKYLHLSNEEYIFNNEINDPKSPVYQNCIIELKEKIKNEIFMEKKFLSALKPVNDFFEKFQNSINNISHITISEDKFLFSVEADKNSSLDFNPYCFIKSLNDSSNSTFKYKYKNNDIRLSISKKSFENKVVLNNNDYLMEIIYKEVKSIDMFLYDYLNSINLATSSDKKKYLGMYIDKNIEYINNQVVSLIDFSNLKNLYNFLEDIQMYSNLKLLIGNTIDLKNIEEENEIFKITYDVDLQKSYNKYMNHITINNKNKP